MISLDLFFLSCSFCFFVALFIQFSLAFSIHKLVTSQKGWMVESWMTNTKVMKSIPGLVSVTPCGKNAPPPHLFKEEKCLVTCKSSNAYDTHGYGPDNLLPLCNRNTVKTILKSSKNKTKTRWDWCMLEL